MATWRPMSNGTGQTTGDIYQLHAYAHRAGPRRPASWSLYWHSVQIDGGATTGLPEVGGSNPCLACLDDYDAHTHRVIDAELIEAMFADPRFR